MAQFKPAFISDRAQFVPAFIVTYNITINDSVIVVENVINSNQLGDITVHDNIVSTEFITLILSDLEVTLSDIVTVIEYINISISEAKPIYINAQDVITVADHISLIAVVILGRLYITAAVEAFEITAVNESTEIFAEVV